MARKRNRKGINDKDVENLRKSMRDREMESQAPEKAKEAFAAGGLKSAFSAYKETAAKERLAKTGKKTGYGEMLKGAGFDNLGSFVGAFFDKKGSEEEIKQARKELGYKDDEEETDKKKKIKPVKSNSGAQQKLKQIGEDIKKILTDVAYIRERVSPKQIDIGKGQNKQSMQFDPLAPSGEQVRGYTESGKLSTLKPSAKDEKSVIMKAALLASKLAVKADDKEEKDKKTYELNRFKDPTEKSVTSEDFGATDPLMALKTSMEENFQKVFERLDKLDKKVDEVEANSDKGLDPTELLGRKGMRGLKKAGRAIGRSTRALGRVANTVLRSGSLQTAVGVGAVATVMYGTAKMATGGVQKEQMDKNVKAVEPYGLKLKYKVGKANMPEDIKYELNGKEYKFEDLPAEYKTIIRANVGDTRSKESRDAQEEMSKNPAKYQAILAAAKKGEKVPVARTWDGLEKELTEWISKTWAADRVQKNAAADAYLGYFDKIKGKGAVPTVQELVAASGVTIAVPGKNDTPAAEELQEVKVGTPREPQPAPAAAPAPTPQPTQEPLQEISVAAPREAEPMAAVVGAPRAQQEPSVSYGAAPTTTQAEEVTPTGKPAEPAISAPSAPVASAPSAAPAAAPNIPSGSATPKKVSSNAGRDAMIAAMDKRGITDPTQRAAIMAQVAHESGGFTTLSENLNYRPNVLTSMFSYYKRNPDEAAQDAKKPAIIASKIYGSRMGNGPPETGDGWNYRGRGFIQLTGKSNYKKFGVSNPDSLLSPEKAAENALDYMLGYKGDWSDVDSVTKYVNGGHHGLAERKSYFASFKEDPSVTTPGTVKPQPAAGGSGGGGGMVASAAPSPSGGGGSMAPASGGSAAISPKATATPVASTSGATLDNGSKAMEQGKAAAASGTTVAPVVVAGTPPPAAPAGAGSKQTLASAGARSNENTFNRALSRDFSHPTSFTSASPA
jgi:putative chitinase